ncbi:cytochrome c5 family protein [Nitrogeniibacter mangrovi]|uniref:Cytochrome c5 family protein n=1 Tax=Nitrogeniibacter mangrovi TaxID=2016596 RepID=A0A6C1B5X3_9RHOO|nr:c-type cytochrome [Nitrogeniibacter mangrovi]QID19112.1 cytochrome c5 family protein [Nitrogeniibacter mangrovi]
MRMTLIPSLLLVGLLAACGKEEAPPAPPATKAPAAEAPAPKAEAPAPAPKAEAPAPKAEAAAPADMASADGQKVYKATCFLCHGSGAGGAPLFGNAAEWEPRIAQGKDVLYKHAMEGFTGEKGMMPPRGGNPKLTDEEIKAAVDYMVSNAK